MDFLVKFDVQGLEALPPERLAELREGEKVAGEENVRAGRLLRMWRIPGARSSIGIWQAADPDELHEALAALPLFPYLEISVQALASHYIEATEVFAQRSSAPGVSP